MITSAEIKRLKSEAVCYFEGTFDELDRANLPRPRYSREQVYAVIIVPVDQISQGATQ